jgi:hypothetical protein
MLRLCLQRHDAMWAALKKGAECSSNTLVPSTRLYDVTCQQAVILISLATQTSKCQIYLIYAEHNVKVIRRAMVTVIHPSLRVSCLCYVKLFRALCNVHSSKVVVIHWTFT